MPKKRGVSKAIFLADFIEIIAQIGCNFIAFFLGEFSHPHGEFLLFFIQQIVDIVIEENFPLLVFFCCRLFQNAFQQSFSDFHFRMLRLFLAGNSVVEHPRLTYRRIFFQHVSHHQLVDFFVLVISIVTQQIDKKLCIILLQP